MPSRNPWRELEHLLQVEDPALLLKHVEDLSTELGITAEQLGRFRRLDGKQLASQLRCLLRQRRAEGRAARARLAERRAQMAAQVLENQAHVDDGVVLLDVGILLGDVLVHPAAKFIGFQLNNHEPVHIPKRKLRQASKALRPFDDVRCYFDTNGLHLRWRGGRGGLDFIGSTLSWNDRQKVFSLEFTDEQAPMERPVRSPRRRVPSGAWLNEILSDLGFPL